MPTASPHLHSSAYIGVPASWTAALCSAGLCALLASCSGYAGPRSVTNADPAVKIPLIRQAVDRHDHSVVPQMLNDLDSDDAAVRFYAIGALQRLTGQTHGYDWTLDDHHLREPAIAEWRKSMGFDTPASQPGPLGDVHR